MNATTPALYTAYLQGSLTLTARGEWRHEGAPFTNHAVIALFTRSIAFEDGAYYVRIGPQRAAFTCEDTAYFVVELLDETSPWRVKLADGSEEPLDAASLALGTEDQIYCTVKGSHRARFIGGSHQRLLAHAVSDSALRIDGREVAPRREPDAKK